MCEQQELIRSAITTIPDYPKAGILFRDVTSLLQNPQAFRATIDCLKAQYDGLVFDKIVGTEARGFIFGAPLAYALGIAFVPVRKQNKLPRSVLTQSYELEYGVDSIEIHRDAIAPGDRVLLIDDLLATGGTICATAELVRRLGGLVEHAGFVINLPELGGHARLLEKQITPFSLCEFDGH